MANPFWDCVNAAPGRTGPTATGLKKSYFGYFATTPLFCQQATALVNTKLLIPLTKNRYLVCPNVKKWGPVTRYFPTIGLRRALLQPVATNGYALSSLERLGPPPTAPLGLAAMKRHGPVGARAADGHLRRVITKNDRAGCRPESRLPYQSRHRLSAAPVYPRYLAPRKGALRADFDMRREIGRTGAPAISARYFRFMQLA